MAHGSAMSTAERSPRLAISYLTASGAPPLARPREWSRERRCAVSCIAQYFSVAFE